MAVDRGQAHVVLAMLAACVGAAAVGLGHTAGRLVGNRRADWLIPAMALYSVVIVPATALLPAAPAPDVIGPGLLVVYCAIALLLLAAICPPARSGSRIGWITAGVAGLLAFTLGEAAGASSGIAAHLVLPLPVSLAVLVAWCTISTAVVVAGYRLGSAPLWRVGLGFGVIAIAHLYRLAHPPAIPAPSMVFAALRLLGTVVVLFGVAQLLRRALNVVIEERFSHQEDLRVAHMRAEQLMRESAARDHELRNCLTGISGMTTILDTIPLDAPRKRARSAFHNELDRMSGLLDRSGTGPRVTVYDAGRVVDELVALWQLAGLRVESIVAATLPAVGRVSTLAQVLTNILANCARHAPGAKVTVAGRRVGRVVTIQVSDDGGQAGLAELPGPPGMGIGLAISRQLVEAEGGRLYVTTIRGDRRGYTVAVDLPGLIRGPGGADIADALPAPRPPAESQAIERR